MKADTIEIIHGSTVQHGYHNDRIYLIRLAASDTARLVKALDGLAAARQYGKIFAKIPETLWPLFKAAGYLKEAHVPGLFNGSRDGFFVSKFFSKARQEEEIPEELRRLVGRDCEHAGGCRGSTGVPAPGVELCTAGDAPEMSRLYSQIFPTYPFPIQQPLYLKQTMEEGVRYFCIRREGAIVALAAAEVDRNERHAEITDFATLPKWRGKGFAALLLQRIEMELKREGIKTTFTIARADSIGMNVVFQKNRYMYGGFLKKNTQICGDIRNMTVWSKQLCSS